MRQATERAWEVDFVGDTHLLLLKTINDMNAKRDVRADANSVTIFQSSGTGKSRTVDQLAKLVFTIPFNLRPEAGKLFLILHP